MCWLVGPYEATTETTHIAPLVDDVIYSESFVNHHLDTAYFMETLKVTDDQIKHIANETDGQRNNPVWHL